MSQPIYNTNFSVRAFDTRAEMGRVAAAEAAGTDGSDADAGGSSAGNRPLFPAAV